MEKWIKEAECSFQLAYSLFKGQIVDSVWVRNKKKCTLLLQTIPKQLSINIYWFLFTSFSIQRRRGIYLLSLFWFLQLDVLLPNHLFIVSLSFLKFLHFKHCKQIPSLNNDSNYLLNSFLFISQIIHNLKSQSL